MGSDLPSKYCDSTKLQRKNSFDERFVGRERKSSISLGFKILRGTSMVPLRDFFRKETPFYIMSPEK